MKYTKWYFIYIYIYIYIYIFFFPLHNCHVINDTNIHGAVSYFCQFPFVFLVQFISFWSCSDAHYVYACISFSCLDGVFCTQQILLNHFRCIHWKWISMQKPLSILNYSVLNNYVTIQQHCFDCIPSAHYLSCTRCDYHQ